MDENTKIDEVAKTFIAEKVCQRIDKNRGIRKVHAVGLKTEEAMRECLANTLSQSGYVVRSKTFDSQEVPLSLTAGNLLYAGLKNLDSYLKKLKKVWSQCDVCVENKGTIRFLGEIKTTLSSPPNICDLINKNLTAIRHFNCHPFSIVMYPDIKPETLKEKHMFYVKGLKECEYITKSEFSTLTGCFFVLTNIGWKNGLEKRTLNIHDTEADNLEDIIYDHDLFQVGDTNYSEWERLTTYLKNG